MDNYKQVIGKALKERRLKANLSQKEMSAGIVSPSFYSKVERGYYSIDITSLLAILHLNTFDVEAFLLEIEKEVGSSDDWYIKSIRSLFKKVQKEGYTFENQKQFSRIKDSISNIQYNGKIISKEVKVELNNLQEIMTKSKREISPKNLKKEKKLISNLTWDLTKLPYLTLIMEFLDVDESFGYVKEILHKFTNNTNMPFPIALTLLIEKYLYWTWKKHGRKEDMLYVINTYLNNLLPYINFTDNVIVVKYYRALINDDKELQEKYIWTLKQLNYYDTIKDIAEE